MLRTVICFTPFMVCLFWLVIFILGYLRHDHAKRVLTWFLAVCTVLYLCHALSFTEGIGRVMECLWALCSLSVYPIYYLYIHALTSAERTSARQLAVLIPGIVVVILMSLWPGRLTDMLRMLLFGAQIVLVCWNGVKRIRTFDNEVASCYANVEGRKATDVKTLLVALVVTSALSAAVNAIGKAYVGAHDMLLFPIALLFSVMLFALSYIGYIRQFSYRDLSKNMYDETPGHIPEIPNQVLGDMLDKLMNEERLYLKDNLKITDVAERIGTCRTYLSNYLNQDRGESFSDYVNRLRIEHARILLQEDPDLKNTVLAEKLGFANEQGFYRNFKKFTNMTPSQWKAESRRKKA